MSKIQVWIKDVGKRPRHVWISNTLKSFQDAVGGYIEHYPLSPNVGILCNEEGLIRDFKFNCELEGQQFFGSIVFIGYDGENFDSCPLTKEDMHKYFEHLYEKETEK